MIHLQENKFTKGFEMSAVPKVAKAVLPFGLLGNALLNRGGNKKKVVNNYYGEDSSSSLVNSHRSDAKSDSMIGSGRY